jgi:uncharacterized membrane protein YbhN (UPF0104 family)
MDRRRLLARLAGLGAGAALFGAVVLSSDLERTLALLSRVGPGLLWIVPASLLPFLLDAVAFRTLLAGLGTAARLGPLLRVTLSVESAVLVVPGGPLLAEALRPFLLERAASSALPESVAVTLTRKALLAMAHGVTLLACFALGYGFLVRQSANLVGAEGLAGMVLGAGVIVILVAGLALRGLSRGAAARGLHAGALRLPSARLRAWATARGPSFAEVDQHLGTLLRYRRRHLAVALAWLVANWLADALVTALLLRLLEVPLGFVEVLCLDAALSLVRSLAFVVPAGLGVQDLGWAAVLAALGLPDAAALAAAFVLLKRSKELLWAGLGGALLALPWRGRERTVAAPSGRLVRATG